MQALKVPLYAYHDVINYTNNVITFFDILRSISGSEATDSIAVARQKCHLKRCNPVIRFCVTYLFFDISHLSRLFLCFWIFVLDFRA